MIYKINLDKLRQEFFDDLSKDNNNLDIDDSVISKIPDFIEGKEELHDILEKLLTDKYSIFVDGIDWVSPKPITFRVHLKNDETFQLQVDNKYWMAIVQGKRYRLVKKSKIEQASKAITRILQFKNDDIEDADFEDETDKEDLQENKTSIKYKIKLNEASLKSDDLLKPYYSNMSLYGKGYEKRGDRFLEKILKGEALELKNGGKVIIDKNKSSEAIESMKNGNFSRLTFYDNEENKYKLSDFYKSEEFGGLVNKSSRGAAKTAIQESAQCVVNALVYKIKNGKAELDDLTKENIELSFNYVDISESKSEVEDFILNNPDQTWQQSLIDIANKLYSHFPGNFEFHRDSKFVQKLIKTFYRTSRIAGLNLFKDKWNPADIWMVNPEVKNYEFSEIFEELNSQLLSLFKDKKLIGVSLKKTKGEPQIDVYNLDKDSYIKKEYSHFKSTPKSKSSDIYLKSGESITFRNFQGDKQFAGEIKGKNAMQGKIGIGPINSIFKIHNVESPLVPSKVLSNLMMEDTNERKTILSELLSLYKKYTGGTNEQFKEKWDDQGRFWATSKYNSLKIVDVFENMDSNTRDKIISDILAFGKSSTELSSVFIKIH